MPCFPHDQDYFLVWGVNWDSHCPELCFLSRTPHILIILQLHLVNVIKMQLWCSKISHINCSHYSQLDDGQNWCNDKSEQQGYWSNDIALYFNKSCGIKMYLFWHTWPMNGSLHSVKTVRTIWPMICYADSTQSIRSGAIDRWVCASICLACFWTGDYTSVCFPENIKNCIKLVCVWLYLSN